MNDDTGDIIAHRAAESGILVGTRDERRFIDGPEIRHPYSVRPAYHPDPTPGVPSSRDERVTALWALLGALAIIAAFVAAHLLMPHVAFVIDPPTCLPLGCPVPM